MHSLYTQAQSRPLISGQKPVRRRCYQLRRREVAQRLDERAIGLEQILVSEELWRHPAKLLTIEGTRAAAEALDDPQRELDVPVRVAMLEPHERAARLNLDAELLTQLACQRRAFGLAVRDLAARKLPAARLMAARWTLRDEHAPGAVVECRRHHQHHGQVACGGGYSTLDSAPWQCLYFLPEPHGQGSLRPTLGSPRTKGSADSG